MCLRSFSEKWGDPSKLDNDQLLLHQLAVMGQEQYEQTLRRFKGQEPTVDLLQESKGVDGASSDTTNSALQYSMAKSLEALASGQLGAMKKPGRSGAAVAAAARTSALQQKDDRDAHDSGDDSKEESPETMRQRRARSAAAAAAAAAAGKKKVAFNSSGASSASASGAAVSAVVDDSASLSSLGSGVPSKRRALLVSVLVGLLVLLLAGLLLASTSALQDSLFPLAPQRIQPSPPANAASALSSMPSK